MERENPIKWFARSYVGRVGLTALILATAACGASNQDTPTVLPLAPTPTTEPTKTPTVTPTPEQLIFPDYGVYTYESVDGTSLTISPFPDGRLYFAFLAKAIPCSNGKVSPFILVRILDKETAKFVKTSYTFNWSLFPSAPTDTSSINGHLQNPGTISGNFSNRMPLPDGSNCAVDTEYTAKNQGFGEEVLLRQFAEDYTKLTKGLAEARGLPEPQAMSNAEAKAMIEQITNRKLP